MPKSTADEIQFIMDVMNRDTDTLSLVSMVQDFGYVAPQLVDSSRESEVENKLDSISKAMGGVPKTFLMPEDGPQPTFDTFLDSAIDEIIKIYWRARKYVLYAKLYQLSEKFQGLHHEQLTGSYTKDELETLNKLVLEEFYDKAEIAFIRIASFWDRVGQLLDYVFFNIRQYEREVFPLVVERIQQNYANYHKSIDVAECWKRIAKFKNSDKHDGFQWLQSRRNILIHSLHLSVPDESDDTKLEYLCTKDHIKEKQVKKLQAKEPSDEMEILIKQLYMASMLFIDVLDLCVLGSEAQKAKHKRNPHIIC